MTNVKIDKHSYNCGCGRNECNLNWKDGTTEPKSQEEADRNRAINAPESDLRNLQDRLLDTETQLMHADQLIIRIKRRLTRLTSEINVALEEE